MQRRYALAAWHSIAVGEFALFVLDCFLHIGSDGMPVRANRKNVRLLWGSRPIEVTGNAQRIQYLGCTVCNGRSSKQQGRTNRRNPSRWEEAMKQRRDGVSKRAVSPSDSESAANVMVRSHDWAPSVKLEYSRVRQYTIVTACNRHATAGDAAESPETRNIGDHDARDDVPDTDAQQGI
jgi:hypothetical protein